MDTWEEARRQALEGRRTSSSVDDLLGVLAKAGVEGLYPTRCLYQLTQVARLASDFIDVVERLASTRSRLEVATSVVCVREAARTLFRTVEDMSSSLEQLISHVEDQLMPLRSTEDNAKDDKDEDDSADRNDFDEPTDRLQTNVQAKLDEVGIAVLISHPLAQTIAETYAECVQFHRELSRLRTLSPNDVEMVLSVLLDLQYSVDVQLRRLLQDDVATEGGFAFTAGLLSLSGLFLAQFELPLTLAETHHVPTL